MRARDARVWWFVLAAGGRAARRRQVERPVRLRRRVGSRGGRRGAALAAPSRAVRQPARRLDRRDRRGDDRRRRDRVRALVHPVLSARPRLRRHGRRCSTTCTVTTPRSKRPIRTPRSGGSGRSWTSRSCTRRSTRTRPSLVRPTAASRRSARCRTRSCGWPGSSRVPFVGVARVPRAKQGLRAARRRVPVPVVAVDRLAAARLRVPFLPEPRDHRAGERDRAAADLELRARARAAVGRATRSAGTRSSCWPRSSISIRSSPARRSPGTRIRATCGIRTGSDVTEDELVAGIRERLRGVPDERVLLGIGDDAAVWQPSRSNRSVITTDALVEGVHFTRAADERTRRRLARARSEPVRRRRDGRAARARDGRARVSARHRPGVAAGMLRRHRGAREARALRDCGRRPDARAGDRARDHRRRRGAPVEPQDARWGASGRRSRRHRPARRERGRAWRCSPNGPSSRSDPRARGRSPRSARRSRGCAKAAGSPRRATCAR